METANELKQVVKEKYGEIAKASKSSGCCGPTCCGGSDSKIVGYTVMQDEYDHLEGKLILAWAVACQRSLLE